MSNKLIKGLPTACGTAPYDSPVTAFLPWKNMKATIEIHCPCGEHLCIESDFAYRIVCLMCGRVFAMPYEVPVQIIENADYKDGSITWDQDQEINVQARLVIEKDMGGKEAEELVQKRLGR